MNLFKKINLLFILAIISIFSLNAQVDIPGKVEWSDEMKEPNNSFLSKIISQDEDGFYVLRRQAATTITSGAPKIFIEHYDRNMRLKRSEKIDLRYQKKDRKFEDVIMLGREIYLLTSFHNQKHKSNYLFAQKISKRLVLSQKIIKIGEVPTRSVMKEGGFGYHISKDSSKILVYNNLPYKKGEPEQFAFNVYNSDFEQLWNKKVRLPYKDEKFTVEEYRIDNNGNVYLMGVVFLEGRTKNRKGNPNYQYSILAYTNEGEEKEEYKIKLDEQFITDLTFRVGNDGNLVCSGFYSDRGTFSIKGTYFFRIDSKSKEIFNKNIKAFDIDFLTSNLTDRRAEKLKKAVASGDDNKAPELYEYDLDELILRSDGGALLIAEQYYVERRENFNNFYSASRFSRSNVGNRFYYEYYYNDIIIVNIKPNGEIEWTSRIPKRQQTINDGGYYSSYSRSIVRDKIYFIYNENRRNFGEDGRRLYNFDGRNSIIALSEVNQNGEVKTYPLASNRDAQVITRPKVCKQIGKKEMIIYGEIGRNFRFGSLKFE